MVYYEYLYCCLNPIVLPCQSAFSGAYVLQQHSRSTMAIDGCKTTAIKRPPQLPSGSSKQYTSFSDNDAMFTVQFVNLIEPCRRVLPIRRDAALMCTVRLRVRAETHNETKTVCCIAMCDVHVHVHAYECRVHGAACGTNRTTWTEQIVRLKHSRPFTVDRYLMLYDDTLTLTYRCW